MESRRIPRCHDVKGIGAQEGKGRGMTPRPSSLCVVFFTAGRWAAQFSCICRFTTASSSACTGMRIA